MDLPVLSRVDLAAARTVADLLYDAKRRLGERDSTTSTRSGSWLCRPPRVSLAGIDRPLVVECERLIRNLIEKQWNLGEYFKYFVKYMYSSCDNAAMYYYFEAIFSQPTPQDPVPRQTASVFFRVRDQKTEDGLTPTMSFRVEGQYAQHETSQVPLTPAPILATLRMKADLFRSVEEIGVF